MSGERQFDSETGQPGNTGAPMPVSAGAQVHPPASPLPEPNVPPASLPRPNMLRAPQRRIHDFREASGAPSQPSSSGQVPRGVAPALTPQASGPSDTLTFIAAMADELVAKAAPSAKAPPPQSPPSKPRPRRLSDQIAIARRSSKSVRWFAAVGLAACGLLAANTVLGRFRSPSDEVPAAEVGPVQAAHAVPAKRAAAVAAIVEKRTAQAPASTPPVHAEVDSSADAEEPDDEDELAMLDARGDAPPEASKAQPATDERARKPRSTRKRSRARARQRAKDRPTATPSPTDLLQEAKQALSRNRPAQAYRLARASNRKSPSAAAARLMTLAACSMGNKKAAKAAFGSLSFSERSGLRGQCRERGVWLGL